jgi:hypothetical protein
VQLPIHAYSVSRRFDAWSIFAEYMELQDREMVEDLEKDVDTHLVFVGDCPRNSSLRLTNTVYRRLAFFPRW